jgi:CBS domain-containing protein
MNPGVLSCSSDNSLGQVAQLLAQHHVHSLFIFNDEPLPVGVITDYDVMAGEWLSGDAESLSVMRKMTAGELMTTPVEMVDADESADDAAARMRENSIRRLLVIDEGKPVGVLSVSDFIADLASKIPVKREKVSDVMSDAYLVCRDKTPLSAALRAMSDAGWRSVVVVNAQGKPLGIFSGLDLIACCDQDKGLDSILVKDVMHPALMIRMDASLQDAAKLMIESHHHRLLVTDSDDADLLPLGVISSFDIVSEMARPESVWQT